MFKFMLVILVSMSVIGCEFGVSGGLETNVAIIIDNAPIEVDKVQCGKYAIYEDEARIELTQLTDVGNLYVKMLEVQVIKMDITSAHAMLDESMGVTKNNQVLKDAAQSIINETVRLTELYKAVLFEIEVKSGAKALIDEEYVKLCGDYITTRNDLHNACGEYSDILKDTINCRVLNNVKQTIDVLITSHPFGIHVSPHHWDNSG